MKYALYILLLCSVAFGTLKWGCDSEPPVVFLTSTFVNESNQLDSVYKVQNIVGDLLETKTTSVQYTDGFIVTSNAEDIVITKTNIVYFYNNRPITVQYISNTYVSTLDKYLGLRYSNILVIAVSNSMLMNTNSQHGTTDVWTTESVQAASLATNLWPGSQLLVISTNALRYSPIYALTYPGFRYSCMLNLDMWNTNVVGDALYQNVMQYYCTPISNYIAAHPEIRLVAMSYALPVNMRNRSGGVTYEYCNSAHTFLMTTGLGDLGGISGTNTKVKVFSFGCRTFDDTTNLLVKCSNFDIYHKSNAYWAIDSKGASLDFNYNLTALTNYGAEDYVLNNNYTNLITVTNLPVIMYWSLGYHTGVDGDDYFLRKKTLFDTFPNSFAGLFESYPLTSLILCNVSGRYDQAKGYDLFAPDCNQGTDWSRSYGATFGAVKEPYWTINGESIYIYYTLGYSFIDCSYMTGYTTTHQIICGHPFLRITDHYYEDLLNWGK